MVQRSLFILFLFLLFVLEGTWFQWMTPDVWGIDMTFVPEFTLVVVMLSAMFFGVRQGTVYAFLFGLMHDLAFGHTIGVYVFSFMFVVYLTGIVSKQFYKYDIVIYTTVILGLVLHLTLIYGLYRLFQVTQMSWGWMFYREILPSLLFNGLFLMIVNAPLKRWFRRMGAVIEA